MYSFIDEMFMPAQWGRGYKGLYGRLTDCGDTQGSRKQIKSLYVLIVFGNKKSIDKGICYSIVTLMPKILTNEQSGVIITL
jgi:hypothetical protein